MKKKLMIGFGLVALLASCSKTVDCECEFTEKDGQGYNYSYKYDFEVKGKKGEEACKENEFSKENAGYTQALKCELK